MQITADTCKICLCKRFYLTNVSLLDLKNLLEVWKFTCAKAKVIMSVKGSTRNSPAGLMSFGDIWSPPSFVYVNLF